MNMWEAPESEESSCDIFWVLIWPGGGGGAFDVPLWERARAANTHPIKVPANTKIWAPNSTRVEKWIPITFGRTLCPRNGRFRTVVVELSSESVRKVSGCGGASLTGT